MSQEQKIKNPIELHKEMYERRCREAAWYRGQTLKEVVERINAMPALRRQLAITVKDGKQRQGNSSA